MPKPLFRSTKLHLIASTVLTMCLSSTSHADTLRTVMQRSIDTNPNVLAYKENRLSAIHAIEQANAGYFPKIKALLAYGPQRSRNSNTIALAQNAGTDSATVTMPVFRAGLTLNQNVFSGFETKGEVARNKARANSISYQLLASIQDTAFNTAQFYFDVLQEQSLVKLAEENVAAHRKILKMIASRTDAGLSNEADEAQTRGRLALAESQLMAEKSNLQDAIARYRTATGEYPTQLSMPRSLPSSLLPRNEHQAMQKAIFNYPVVKQAQSDISQAYQQYQVSKAVNYPRLDILADINRNRNEGGLRGPSYDEAIFLQATYDLLAGGAQIARQRETAHLHGQAKEIMNNSTRQARENAKIAWNLYDTSRKVLPMLRQHKTTTANTLDAYQKQYTLGKRTLFDLLDVQNELYNAKRDYTTGQFKVLSSQYRLLHSTGSLVYALHLSLPSEINTYYL